VDFTRFILRKATIGGKRACVLNATELNIAELHAYKSVRLSCLIL